MPPLRVLLAGLPPLLEGILLDAFEQAPDMVVATQALHHSELIARLNLSLYDIVVLASTDADAAVIVAPLRLAYPTLTVMTIAPTGDRALLFDGHASPTVLQDVSAATLVKALRESR